MAMYVLLSFEDDERALYFVEGFMRGPETDKVEGIYKKPTQFCDRLDPIHGNHRVIGWRQGQKYGWWICAKCGKPSAVASRNIPNEIGGWNLLDRLFKKEEPESQPFDILEDRREHMDRDEGLHS